MTGRYPVSGQTYSRKLDSRVLQRAVRTLPRARTSSPTTSACFQHLKEVEEPFEKSQIGSSAMAYKRNPMRSERIASLARYVMSDAHEPGHYGFDSVV